MMTQDERGGCWARRGLVMAMATALMACGGGGGGGGDGGGGDGGGGGTPTSYTLSGTIAIAPTAAVDSDTNDVNQQGWVRNNDLASAQALTSPVLVVGTVNEPGAGPEGNNLGSGDEADIYQLELVAGQVVELEFAEDPTEGDIDLYVVDPERNIFGVSNGQRSRFECVTISTPGTYYVSVEAYSGSSIYSLRIGAPGSAPSCTNRTQSLTSVVPGEVLATPHRSAGARERAAAAASGLETLGTLAATGLQRLRVPAEAAQRQSGLERAQAAGGGSATASARSAQDPFAQLADAGAREALSTLRYAKSLQSSGAWRAVGPNWRMAGLALVGTYPPNDRLYSYQRWHYESINLPAAMERISGLASQPAQRPLVAVVDSGVVLDHPDLAPQLISAGRSFLDNGARYTDSADDGTPQSANPSFHGTHVAGTVGASTFDGVGGAGVAPMAQILPVRVLGDDGKGSLYDILQGVLYSAGLANEGGTPPRKADVINLSLGGDRSCDPGEQEVYDQVRAAGVIVVAAAGNSGHNDIDVRADVGAPANCNHVIAVSAVDATQNLTWYSNTGSAIDVAAPGGDTAQSTTGNGSPDGIYSDVANFDAGGQRQPSFGPMQGTSMASPHVAGVAALMRYVNPAITPEEIDTLIAAGRITTGIGGSEIDFGAGLIDARKAVDEALALAGGGGAPVEGVIVASPSSLDFGAVRSSVEVDLRATAATGETVVSVVADTPALSVAAGAVDAGGRGRYTVAVDRAALSGAGPFYQSLTVTLSSGRSFSVPVTISMPSTATNAGASYGPLYVLVLDAETEEPLHQATTHPVNGRYTWRIEGVTSSRVAVIAGGDLDNDDILCQRGEPCGGYPVFGTGGGITVLEPTGDLADLDFEVAPRSGISAQSVGTSVPTGYRKLPSAAAAAAARAP